MEPISAGYEIVDFDALRPVPCPCGPGGGVPSATCRISGTVHRTEITAEVEALYHNHCWLNQETYYILQCEADARMALDGKIIPVKTGRCAS